MQKKHLILAVSCLIAVFSAAVYLTLCRKAFPSASVTMTVSREEARAKACALLSAQGLAPKTFDSAVTFGYSNETLIYLQKQFGLERTNALIEDGVPMWCWRVRFFRELEKEEATVGIDSATGETMFYRHAIAEAATGADVSQDIALTKATVAVAGWLANAKTPYVINDKSSEKKPKRTDHGFVWEDPSPMLGEAHQRISALVQGSELGGFGRFVKLPEQFSRELIKELSPGIVMAKICSMLQFMLLIASVFFLMFRVQAPMFNVRGGAMIAGTFGVLLLVSFLNSLGPTAAGYQNTVSKAVYWVNAAQGSLTDAFSQGIILFALYTLGIMLGGDARSRVFPQRQSIAVGFAAGVTFAAYIAIFYLVVSALFPIWVSPEIGYSDMFAAKIPAFQLGLFSFDAALFEELTFRVLIPAFIARWSGKLWVGALAGALLWGFAHSSYMVYPVYVRGIELTIGGLGLFWVYRRFGLAAAVIAHYVADCFLAGVPFVFSKDISLFWGFAAALAAAPCIAFLFAYADGSKMIRLRPHLNAEQV